MRAILTAVLLLCLTRGAQEPDDSMLNPDVSQLGGGTVVASLGDVDLGAPSGDQKTNLPPDANIKAPNPALAAPQNSPGPAANSGKTNSPAPAAAAPQTAPVGAAQSGSTSKPLPNRSLAGTAPQVPLDDLCSELVTSAENNGLPVAFFANLIWQESRLRENAVSPKGALGIAQFMPKVAVESGLQNPFDPKQALSASARLLRELRDQFGNLGFVAAAYNAGAKRVSEWLGRHRTLPRETRGYVMNITGSSVEQWQKAPPNDDALQLARRLPCRDLPAFAALAQQAQQQAKLQQAKPVQQQVQQAQAQPPQTPQKPAVEAAAKAAAPPKPERVAATKHTPAPPRHEQERVAEIKRAPAPPRHEQVHVAEAKHAPAPPRHEAERVAEIRRARPPRREEVHIAERERIGDRHEARERIRHVSEERHRRA